MGSKQASDNGSIYRSLKYFKYCNVPGNVYIVHTEQNNSNKGKICPQNCIISFYLKDMHMFNKLVVRYDPVKLLF